MKQERGEAFFTVRQTVFELHAILGQVYGLQHETENYKVKENHRCY